MFSRPFSRNRVAAFNASLLMSREIFQPRRSTKNTKRTGDFLPCVHFRRDVRSASFSKHSASLPKHHASFSKHSASFSKHHAPFPKHHALKRRASHVSTSRGLDEPRCKLLLFKPPTPFVFFVPLRGSRNFYP